MDRSRRSSPPRNEWRSTPDRSCPGAPPTSGAPASAQRYSTTSRPATMSIPQA